MCGTAMEFPVNSHLLLSLWKPLGFYQTKDEFRLDFAHIKHDHVHGAFIGTICILSASVCRLESFLVTVTLSKEKYHHNIYIYIHYSQKGLHIILHILAPNIIILQWQHHINGPVLGESTIPGGFTYKGPVILKVFSCHHGIILAQHFGQLCSKHQKWWINTTCKSTIDQRHQGPLLLTWFNFNPSMDK